MKTLNTLMRRAPVFAALGLLVLANPSRVFGAEPQRLDLAAPGWEFSGEDTVVEEFDGRLALRLKSGKATYRKLEFLDGTIEFDLQVTEHRSFAYLYFRMEDDDEHEEFYFRSHKTLLPDAVQYTPVYKGRSQWQLYHDAGSTAAAPLPAGEWIPVKVVVKGSQAAVFVGSTEEPQLVVHRLAREPKPGFLALRSFKTFGTPADTYVANFANIVVRPGVVDFTFPVPEPRTPTPGLVTDWQVSRAFAPEEGPKGEMVLEIPAEVSMSSGWRTVPANADGLVEFERHLERPDNARRAAVVARLGITADEAKTVRLNLGFSDELTVFLNGQLLVADDESYSFNSPRRQGLLTGDQLSVFLPLEKGANELLLVVTDSFGGWGLSGRFEDAEGVTVEAPE